MASITTRGMLLPVLLMPRKSFKKYLDIVENNLKVEDLSESQGSWPGSFKAARKYQERILRPENQSSTPAQAPFLPPPPLSHTTGGLSMVVTRSQTIGMHALRTIRSPPFLRGSKRERSHSNSGEYDPSPDYKPSSTDGSSSRNPRPSRKKSKSGKEDAENEVTVNTALILFVEAVSELIPLLKCDWSPTQEMFVSKFNKAISRARIDGCLRTKAENSIQALVEVKAGSRGSKDEEKIQMQESAEMVSWLFRKPRNLPNLNG